MPFGFTLSTARCLSLPLTLPLGTPAPQRNRGEAAPSQVAARLLRPCEELPHERDELADAPGHVQVPLHAPQLLHRLLDLRPSRSAPPPPLKKNGASSQTDSW
jgi:hypothetical protein